MDSSSLWYNLNTKTLKPLGFVISPYGRYIENIIIYDKKCTISWYVDNNKVPHVEEIIEH